jgi:putative membrane protein insertion efficiency factor
MVKGIVKIIVWIFKLPIHLYRHVISPIIPASCRHVPTCSQYAIEALDVHGPLTGLWLATRRILHCHPWGTHGYDPVPPAKQKTKNL